MPRPIRIYSNSKIYHIIFKGIDNQNIFYDNQDREIFLKQILITKTNFNYDVYAYCLMDNHVHMIIKCEDKFLSKSMQSLIIRYAYYFNKKYRRIGPFLQNRFKSRNIEDKRYFLRVCRYVHRNPENAGICKTEDYKWSSYREYIGKERIINKKILMYYFDNNLEEFKNYTINQLENINDFIEFEIIEKLTDEQLSNIIMKLFKIKDINEIPIFFKSKDKVKLEQYLEKIKNIQGTNVTQIARVIRINRKIIDNLYKGKNGTGTELPNGKNGTGTKFLN